MRSIAITTTVLSILAGCSHSSPHETADAPTHLADGSNAGSDGSGSADASNPLALSCAVSTTAFTPAECPAPSGTAGQATFCYRPQWPGVTNVDVLGGFGKTGDWTTPLASLTDQGNGTWSATVSLTGGPFPYIFRVKGTTDGTINKNGEYVIDQLNPSFVPPPAGSPYPRSVSQLTLPQPAPTIHHVTGSVQLSGEAQPCFLVIFDVGELLNGSGGVVSEHGDANFVEVGPDGTFDVPVADGPVLMNVKYPFGLTTTYPDPATTPSVGVARAGATVAGSDVALQTTDVTYATADYAAMTPVSGTSSAAPIAFSWDLAAGASGSYMSITATNIAGNDPAYTSGSAGSATAASWDGKLNNGSAAPAGTYYWGTWQKRGIWSSESLEFPITLE